jgi:hypothetical protein
LFVTVHGIQLSSTSHEIHLVKSDPFASLEHLPESIEEGKDRQGNAIHLQPVAVSTCQRLKCEERNVLCNDEIGGVPIALHEDLKAIEDDDDVDEEESRELTVTVRNGAMKVALAATHPYQLK